MFKEIPHMTRVEKQSLIRAYEAVIRARGQKRHHEKSDSNAEGSTLSSVPDLEKIAHELGLIVLEEKLEGRLSEVYFGDAIVGSTRPPPRGQARAYRSRHRAPPDARGKPPDASGQHVLIRQLS